MKCSVVALMACIAGASAFVPVAPRAMRRTVRESFAAAPRLMPPVEGLIEHTGPRVRMHLRLAQP
jgi:hypothetical protein